MAQEKRDYRQEVTDSIIKMLEDGTAPWQKPWEGGSQFPYNPTTGKSYRGGNVMWLMAMGMERGYADPRWMTYKQASENGWQVRKGEKATAIEFWDIKPGKDDEDDKRFIHRTYAVFNAQQIDGIPPLEVKKREPLETVEAGETILKNSGADIRYGGGRAYYSKDSDHIQLPTRECFPNAEGFYGTALHELLHWTGNEKRLNRQFGKFGDEPYAREELRAELGSMMLAAERGIPHDPANHAAYVQSWIRALKDDKNEIFRAASDASKACDYVLSLEHSKEPVSFADRVMASRAEREPASR